MIGETNERNTIQRETLSDDGQGGSTRTLATLATCWAKVVPLSGKERDMANQTESPRNYRFTVRRTSETAGVLAKDLIVWRNKTMNIRFIGLNSPKELYLQIEAEDGVAA